jgi:hypothetical protein
MPLFHLDHLSAPVHARRWIDVVGHKGNAICRLCELWHLKSLRPTAFVTALLGIFTLRLGHDLSLSLKKLAGNFHRRKKKRIFSSPCQLPVFAQVRIAPIETLEKFAQKQADQKCDHRLLLTNECGNALDYSV